MEGKAYRTDKAFHNGLSNGKGIVFISDEADDDKTSEAVHHCKDFDMPVFVRKITRGPDIEVDRCKWRVACVGI